MKAKCGGQEVDIPDETAEEMEEALIALKIAQEELDESEKELSEQKGRKRWHDYTLGEKVKAILGRDPNGGQNNGHRQDVCGTCQRTDCDGHGDESTE